MKRSEMINKITNLLKDWENCTLNNRTSEDILNLLESEGMRPPFWKYETEDSDYDCETRSYVSIKYPVYEWEPE